MKKKIHKWITRKISKRRRFIISTAMLSLIMLTSTFLRFDEISYFVPLIIIAVYIFTYFAIFEGITRAEYVMLFIAPVYFSLAFYLFYFFLPQRWLTRLPFIAIYTVSIYAIMLSQNIFNVGVVKSLQLYRAAFSVNYLFMTITTFLIASLLFSLKFSFYMNGLVLFLLSAPLALHVLWTADPAENIKRDIIRIAFFVGIIIGEAGVIFSFLPLNSAVFALVITGIFYSLVGLFQAHIQDRLFYAQKREYLFVCAFIFMIALLSLKW